MTDLETLATDRAALTFTGGALVTSTVDLDSGTTLVMTVKSGGVLYSASYTFPPECDNFSYLVDQLVSATVQELINNLAIFVQTEVV